MDETLMELYAIGLALFAVGAPAIFMSIIPTKDGPTLFSHSTTEVMINSAIPAFWFGILFLYLGIHWGFVNSFYPSMISHEPAQEWG